MVGVWVNVERGSCFLELEGKGQVAPITSRGTNKKRNYGKRCLNMPKNTALETCTVLVPMGSPGWLMCAASER